MLDVGAWAKLAAYVVCIGLVLEFAYQAYWRVRHLVLDSSMSTAWRAIISVFSSSIPLVAVILVTGAFCNWMDGQPLRSVGLQRDSNSMIFLAGGITTAFASVSVLFLTGCGIGWFKIQRSISQKQMPAFCGGTCDFSLAAIVEEIAIRGYVFSIIQHAWGGAVAVTGSAAIFSLFHLVKHPKMPLIFALNAFFFGVLTAQARLATGSLWMPIGLHFGWNIAMGPVFGLPLSGRIYNSGLVTCVVEGPEWFTGGLYSPDAGIMGTIALIIAAIVLSTFTPIY